MIRKKRNLYMTDYCRW